MHRCWDVNGCGHDENSVAGPRNIKDRSTVQPSNPPSGYLSKGNENKNSERYVHPHVHRSVIYNNQDMEATYVSVDEWIKNKCGMYVYVESKKNNPNSQIQRTDWWPAGGRRRLRREEGVKGANSQL